MRLRTLFPQLWRRSFYKEAASQWKVHSATTEWKKLAQVTIYIISQHQIGLSVNQETLRNSPLSLLWTDVEVGGSAERNADQSCIETSSVVAGLLGKTVEKRIEVVYRIHATFSPAYSEFDVVLSTLAAVNYESNCCEPALIPLNGVNLPDRIRARLDLVCFVFFYLIPCLGYIYIWCHTDRLFSPW